MKVIIQNKIYISDAPGIAVAAIKKALTLPNPKYFMMVKKGNVRALWNLKKEFKYYSTPTPNTLSIGRGMLRRLTEFARTQSIITELNIDTQKEPLSAPLVGTITLRDYQQVTLKQLLDAGHENGIFKLGTGWGKTVLACQLVQSLNMRTLIIVPRDSILLQFQKEFQKWFGYKVGIIKGQTIDIQEITVASIATLGRRKDLVESIKDKFSMVIADEAHTYITDKRLEVIQAFNPHYLYGMTATPRRTDAQGDAIFFTFGDVLVTGSLPQRAPKVNIVDSQQKIFVQEYADMVAEMVECDARNALIADIAAREVQAGRKVLVLTKRIAHYNYLYDQLNKRIPGIAIERIESTGTKAEREQKFTGLRDGTRPFSVVMGTYSMLSTGVDIPALDTLIFAGDLRSSVLTEQSAGRILRLFQDKPEPKIIDITDTMNGIFRRQAKERENFYLEQGWQVV